MLFHPGVLTDGARQVLSGWEGWGWGVEGTDNRARVKEGKGKVERREGKGEHKERERRGRVKERQGRVQEG